MSVPSKTVFKIEVTMNSGAQLTFGIVNEQLDLLLDIVQ